MINSELREYCEGVISYYSSEYPYYFMHTNTFVSGNSYQQNSATVCLSKTEPSVNSQYNMSSDEWLVVTVFSSNANYNDHSPRVTKSVSRGSVSCSNYEYVYSNVASTFAFSSVSVRSNTPVTFSNTVTSVFSVIMCACLIAGVIGLWLKG